MTDKIGPTFAAELAAAGVTCVEQWRADGALVFADGASDADRTAAQAVLAKHDPSKALPPAPPAPYALFKTDVVTRMTDAELDRFDEGLSAATTRQRRMWADCTRIDSDSPYFGALRDQFTAAFTADRATALLAPSAG